MTIPAGWYDDAQDSRLVRFWDGEQWTAHSAPRPTPAWGAPPPSPAPDHGPSHPMHYIVPIGRSWQSIVAPYLGLCSILPIPIVGHLLGAGGIVFGVMALRMARKGGHGTGRAITGIVLGSIGFIGSTLVLIAITISNPGSS